MKSRLTNTVNSGAMGALASGAGTILYNFGKGCLVGGGVTALAGLELGPLDIVAAGGGCLDGGADAVVGGAGGLVVNRVIGGAISIGQDAFGAATQYYQDMQACQTL